MKVGIFSPYFQTFGGGERYVLTVAEFFLRRGDQVDIFWDKNKNIQKIKERFDIDLTSANFVKDIFSENNFIDKMIDTAFYDLLFILSDGSIPTTLAKRNILHFQTPFNFPDEKTPVNKIKLLKYSTIICNSEFTKKYIDKTYGVDSQVIYPPVDVEKFSSGKKENMILSVGRFFGHPQSKKQEILVDTFKKSKFIGWRLVLIGGLTFGLEDDILKFKKMTDGFAIEIIPDSDFSTLQKYYSRAKIYWHATGFGEDLNKFPERAEHFGITTVEAMAAGAVPIVFNGGGQKEIITEGKNGYFWNTTAELIKRTQKVISDKKLYESISSNAQTRSKDFSKKIFFQKLNEII